MSYIEIPNLEDSAKRAATDIPFHAVQFEEVPGEDEDDEEEPDDPETDNLPLTGKTPRSTSRRGA